MKKWHINNGFRRKKQKQEEERNEKLLIKKLKVKN